MLYKLVFLSKMYRVLSSVNVRTVIFINLKDLKTNSLEMSSQTRFINLVKSHSSAKACVGVWERVELARSGCKQGKTTIKEISYGQQFEDTK